jgi:hypothetical protein
MAPASGSGPQAALEPAGGAQPVMTPGTGAHRAMEPGSGAQTAQVRNPVRGFPPVNPGLSGRGQPEPGQGSVSPWYTPRMPSVAERGGDDGDGNGRWYAGDAEEHWSTTEDGADADGQWSTGEGSGDADGHWYAEEDGAGGQPAGEPGPPTSAAPATRRHGARTRRRSARRALLATAAVVVLAAGGFAGYKYLYEPRVNAPVSPTTRLPTNAPGSPGFDKALGKWQHIGTRAEDPAPLTLTGLFPPRFTLDGVSYVRTAASATTHCSAAVFGSQLQTALQSGHCTQVLRASYISGDGTMMGTIGVVNLITSAAAQQAGKVTGPDEIIAPLSSKKGATSKLGNGTGVVQAEIKGHYLILMWAEFANLKSPSTSAQRQQLEQFAGSLVTGSANIDLSTRMLTGKA